ncbi:MAG TPA: metallophosphoesterase [Dongiaceae bacterium]|jgi:serine/threonine protein phosphatase 1|nr:metallophosphoesterase [Dongiaceae bacterium]
MSISTSIGDWQTAPATATRPVFAIGDVHGRADLFEPLIAAILRVVDEDKLDSVLLVTLGDYVDRGPASLAVLKRVLDGIKHPKVEAICLPGNHEQFLRHFLESKAAERLDIFWSWLDNGADAIARELGLTGEKAEDPDAFMTALASDLGMARIERLFKLDNHYRLGQYVFVHGGLHPQFGLVALKRDWRRLPKSGLEEDRDPLWVRGPFLTYDGEHDEGVIVVHGHTPRDQAELHGNRIGIDTGAYFSGRLTCVQLVQDRMRLIQASER